MSTRLVEHFFRHEYGRLVALLSSRVGLSRLEAVEDAVQNAMLAALRTWAAHGIPDEPSAWLYTVARNELYGSLNRESRRTRILSDVANDEVQPEPEPTFGREVDDELLRMLFVCCDPRLPAPSRIVLALKTLCGFSTAEIAFRLLTTEANVYKRIARARQRLRELDVGTETPPLESLRSRVPSVHDVIYLLFNEGYLSVREDHAIRVELCDEAIRLGGLLADHSVGATPTSHALMALMHLHAARLAGRVDASGALLLLEEQDRTRWDRSRIQQGLAWLERSAVGEALTRFHVEAGIAAEHCLAPTFDETPWARIAELYAMLEQLDPSPFHTLNRAVAVAQARGPQAGLEVLATTTPPEHYLWDAVRADLHRRAGELDAAHTHRERALSGAPSDAVRELLLRRLGG